MVGIKYKDLEDLNKQAYGWCEKVNNKVHSTTNEIPKIRLMEEHLTKVTRPYFININSVRKVEKDCLFSYKGNKYSVPPKYIYRHVVVAGFDNLLQVYCDGEKIATHPISRGKNIAVINKYHYDSISHSKHDKDHNSIFDDAKVTDPHFKWGFDFSPSRAHYSFRQWRGFAAPLVLSAFYKGISTSYRPLAYHFPLVP